MRQVVPLACSAAHLALLPLLGSARSDIACSPVRDGCLSALSPTKIFNRELFGAVAEEKEVKQILSKVMEARRSKSYDSYEILGKFIGKDQVTKLILPLKEVRNSM